MVQPRRRRVDDPGTPGQGVGIVQRDALAKPQARRARWGPITERPIVVGMNRDEIPGVKELVRDRGHYGALILRQRGAGQTDGYRPAMFEGIARAVLHQKPVMR